MTEQSRAARIAGLSLLVICASALLSVDLTVPGDAIATANNLRAHEHAFRLAILGEFVMLNGDIVLALALYYLLAPVHRPLALLGSVWRLANAGLLAVGVLANSVAFDSVADAARGVSLEEQAAWMHAWLNAHGTAESLGLIFFGAGAAIHSYLFYRSRYIPRILSGSYLVVTALICILWLGTLLWPTLESIVVPWILVLDYVVEVGVALWLTFKGVRFSPNP